MKNSSTQISVVQKQTLQDLFEWFIINTFLDLADVSFPHSQYNCLTNQLWVLQSLLISVLQVEPLNLALKDLLNVLMASVLLLLLAVMVGLSAEIGLMRLIVHVSLSSTILLSFHKKKISLENKSLDGCNTFCFN